MIGKRNINDYSTIIWDWNGTLLNDVWLCIEIVNRFLTEHQQELLNENSYKEVFGFPIVDYYKKIGIDLQKESFDLLTEKFISSYESRVKTCLLHERALEVLNAFKHSKSNQFMLTAAHKESVLHLLEHYSIRDYFTAIEGLDNHRADSKVDRGIQLIKKHQMNKNETVLIGDTLHDFEVAKAMGVDCILIANGHQSQQRLTSQTQNNINVLQKIEELLN